jgi:hypothetical protein
VAPRHVAIPHLAPPEAEEEARTAVAVEAASMVVVADPTVAAVALTAVVAITNSLLL